MPIFAPSEEKENSMRLNALIKRAKMLYDKSENTDLITYLDKLANHDSACIIRPLGLNISCVEMIMNNPSDFSVNNHYQAIRLAEKIYKDIFVYDEQTPDAENLRLVFLEFFEEGGVLAKKLFNSTLFNSFNNKYNYITFINSSLVKGDLKKCFSEITEYGIHVREYYIDDLEYTYNLINVAEKLMNSLPPNWNEITEAEILKVKRMNGIYNLDATDVAKAEKELDDSKKIMAEGKELVADIESQIKQLAILKDQVNEEIYDTCDRSMVKLANKSEEYILSLDKRFADFMGEQKEKLDFDRREFLKSMFAESQAELDRLKSMADTIASTTALELTRVNQQAADTVSKIDKMVNDDVQVQRVIKQSIENQAFIDKVNKLSMLNDTNIKAMETVAASPAAVKVKGKTASPAAVVVSEMMEEEEEKIEAVNPLFDTHIPFKSRYEIVMKEKKRREEAGEHYHEKFDDVVTAIMEDANPYLVGPSGCGKTYMIKQIAELLNASFIDIGYINEEYDILGFQTANGGYSRPNFYRCYKYGKIAFCDELDNGNARATVKLNSFLSNCKDASYNFPNGENVPRHPNFRIVGAGNTAGNGADTNYNTREKIEESVQQRFMPIYVGYDNEVEKKILSKYPDWFEFITVFREATDAWAADMMSSAPGIITTRDAAKIKRYLENGSFTIDKIIKYEFIQTKDIEYLVFLKEYMLKVTSQKKASGEKGSAQKLINIFVQQVENIRKKGKR